MPRKRCPENTFCVSNTLIYIIAIIIVIILVSIYNNKKKDQNMLQAIMDSNKQLIFSINLMKH